MRIAMIGAGGIGAYYGAKLQRAGHELLFIARGAQAQALRERGLRVSHPELAFDEPVRVTDMAGLCAEHSPVDFDLLVLAVKGGATAELAEQLRHWFAERGQRTAVLSLQNGVDNEPTLARALGADCVLGGLAIRIGTHVVEPGCIEAVGPGQVTLGPWPNVRAAQDGPARHLLPRLIGQWGAAGIPMQESDDIRRELWRKLVINNGVNPLSAITGWDSRRITHDERIGPMVKRLMQETAVAAGADGVVLDEADVEEMFRVIHDLDPIKTSMLVDREHGRPLELQGICGAVLERSASLGVSATGTELLMALLEKGIWSANAL
ncbi:2-dehydropantoate 2-reductase [Alkalilimnicola sp. S0819]|nr:2-dehydropantoate 2-reductase [Alkalilimnicola sp. S0819]MPQ16869.1 2-dehydropantoate 2-reductase [Alkalilimnicola sp. S0819]